MRKRLIAISVVLAAILALGAVCYIEPFEAETQTKIQHLIFIVQENHSFDNYFGTYPGANGPPPNTSLPVSLDDPKLGLVRPYHLDATLPVSIIGDELPPGVADPDDLSADTSGSVSPFHLLNESLGRDLSHAWAVAH